MHQAIFIVSLIAVLAAGCGTAGRHAGGGTTLYYSKVNVSNPDGKDFAMTFEESRRDARTSTVKVTHESGASVPSIMFVVRGCYDVARARNALYFINLKEWTAEDGGWMYLIGFADDDTVDPAQYFGLPESDSDGSSHVFMSVKNYDLLFKDQP